MAFAYHHEDVITATYAIERMVELIVAAGGSVLASGDGLSAYSSSGDVLTRVLPPAGVTSSAANCANNNNAWRRIQLAGANSPELLIRKTGNGGGTYVLTVSRLGFTGGSPNASTPPTAADSVRILGESGGSGANLGTDLQYAATGSYPCRIDACIGDADEGYSMYFLIRKVGYPDASGFFFDVVTPYDPDDPDPYVFGYARSWVEGNGTAPGDKVLGSPVTATTTPSETASDSWMWAYNGDDLKARIYGLLRHEQFQTNIDMDGVFRYIGSPMWVRSGLQPSTGMYGDPAGKPPVKGTSRLFVGVGNGYSPDLAVITSPEDALCLRRGTFLLRWDGTPYRI